MAVGGTLRRGLSEEATRRAREIVFGGAIAGTFAGSAMALFLIILGGWQGIGWLGVMRAIGGLFYGTEALGGGGPPAFWGLVVHFAVAVALGVLFAAMIRRNADPLGSITAGLLFGIAVWAVMTWVVVRIADPTLAEVADRMSFGWLSAHIIYGVVLGLASQLRGVAAGERPPRRR
jgi:hypothetical protein